eukprot:Gb_37027 [translate_table: standard]
MRAAMRAGAVCAEMRCAIRRSSQSGAKMRAPKRSALQLLLSFKNSPRKFRQLVLASLMRIEGTSRSDAVGTGLAKVVVKPATVAEIGVIFGVAWTLKAEMSSCILAIFLNIPDLCCIKMQFFTGYWLFYYTFVGQGSLLRSLPPLYLV